MSETTIKSGEVQGMRVTGVEGAKLGAARELFVDLVSGQVRFLIVESASLLVGSGKFHPVPWSAVHCDAVAGGFQLKISKDDFKASPSYDRDQLANQSNGWDEQATRYFTPPTMV